MLSGKNATRCAEKMKVEGVFDPSCAGEKKGFGWWTETDAVSFGWCRWSDSQWK